MNMHIEYVEVEGKKYKLQHPGNRAVQRMRTDITLPGGKPDLEKLMDFCFEYCVFPEGHSFKPTLDNTSPVSMEEWQILLPSFLRGLDISKWGCVQQEDGESEEAAAGEDDFLETGNNGSFDFHRG